MKHSEYIGDGVYVNITDECGHQMTITTGHHEEIYADNVVHIEPQVFINLVKVAARFGWIDTPEKKG